MMARPHHGQGTLGRLPERATAPGLTGRAGRVQHVLSGSGRGTQDELDRLALPLVDDVQAGLDGRSQCWFGSAADVAAQADPGVDLHRQAPTDVVVEGRPQQPQKGPTPARLNQAISEAVAIALSEFHDDRIRSAVELGARSNRAGRQPGGPKGTAGQPMRLIAARARGFPKWKSASISRGWRS